MLRVLVLSLCGLTMLMAFPRAGGMQAIYAKETLTVYSHRHYPLDGELFGEFEKRHGVRIAVLQANADELIERLTAEGARTKADLLITVSAVRLDRAVKRGLLAPIASARIEAQIPAALRHPRNYWTALTTRARIIVYNPRVVRMGEVARYQDLAAARWQDKIVMRSSAHGYNVSLLAGLIYNDGISAARRWVRAVAGNLAHTARGNDRDQIRAVARGDAEATLINSYYYGILADTDPDVAAAVAISFPDQDGNGAHVDISGLGIIRYSDQKERATELIEFLTSAAAQTRYAAENYEFPANPAARVSGLMAQWQEMRFDYKAINELSEHSSAAVRIFSESDWR